MRRYPEWLATSPDTEDEVRYQIGHEDVQMNLHQPLARQELLRLHIFELPLELFDGEDEQKDTERLDYSVRVREEGWNWLIWHYLEFDDP